MTDKNPDLDLDPIRARLAAATPGPWVFEPESVSECGDGCCTDFWENRVSSERGDAVVESWQLKAPDAAFIAHSPADIAALLAEVEQLRKQLADVDVPMPEPHVQEAIAEVVAGLERALGESR